MKGRKKLWPVLLVLVVVVVVVGIVLMYADSLVKLGVEVAGSKALGVQTTVGGVSLSLLAGKLSLHDLQVDNPPGYQTDSLLKIKSCAAAVDLKSLLSDTIRVKTIRLEGLEITVEQKGFTSNLAEVLENVKKLRSDKPNDQEPDDDEPTKYLAVDRIEILDSTARIKLLPIPGTLDVVVIKLGPIVLEDISTEGDKAALLTTVCQEVLLALSAGVVRSAGDVLPASMRESLGAALNELTSAAKNVFDKGGKQLVETLEKVLEQPGKVLEGLFEGTKEEESAK